MHSFVKEGLYIDNLIKEWLSQLATPLFDHLFIFITCLGSVWAFITLGILVFFFLAIRKKYLEGIFLNLCLIVTWVTMILLKLFFGRERPPGENLILVTGFSFPSGHAMVSLAFYGFIAYLVGMNFPGKKGKLLVLVLYLLILLIGISRVYLNVHYASDVLAGYLFGGVLLFAFIKGLQVCKRARFNGS
ncbi:MAG: phosphatase PAP2 family protein [Syntrophomonadaceae bacterium]|nr:phosphatase PAP2 family protein [Syntrophomonadaceae bacterium]